MNLPIYLRVITFTMFIGLIDFLVSACGKGELVLGGLVVEADEVTHDTPAQHGLGTYGASKQSPCVAASQNVLSSKEEPRNISLRSELGHHVWIKPLFGVIQAINFSVGLSKVGLVRHRAPNLNIIYLVSNLRIECARLIYHSLPYGLLNFFIIISPLLQGLILPVLEPFPVGESHNGTGRLVFPARVVIPLWVLG